MTRIGVVGATGYTGAELIRILSDHDGVELTSITSRQYAGEKFSDVYPAMTNVVDMVCEELDVDAFCEKVDFVFLALPHKVSMELAPGFAERGLKIVDLSADFRFDDVLKYEAHYQAHGAKDLLKKSVYGLCEVYGDRIKDANIVGNPGCYPTSILLPLIPLVNDNLINADSLIADSKSGVSGAGRSLSMGAHYCEVNEGFKAYNIAKHRHIPEIEEVLSQQAGSEVSITFSPHLLPLTRGMLSTLYVDLTGSTTEADVYKSLTSYYHDKPFVRILEPQTFPNISNVQGTNFCDIGFTLDVRKNRLVIVSVIDNLVKGAAGQAVQNMNIMLGLDETRGLLRTPFPV